jgi:rifampicin phosphotransferase
MSTLAEPTWERPGPGTWTHDAAHSTGPTSRAVQDIFPAAMEQGFRSATARYGILLSHVEVRYVNGYAYGAPRIAGVAPSDGPPPPGWMLWILSRVHPEMRRRDRRARSALRERIWTTDLRRWFDVERPEWIAALLALQSVEPAELDDAELARHIEACADALSDGLALHFSLIGASSVPVGLHIVRETERGRTAASALEDLRGAAVDSTGATIPALRAIADALDASGVEPASLAEVRAASPDAVAALDAYLDINGQRVVGGNDVTARRLLEMPDVILRSIASARSLASPEPDGDLTDAVLADARLATASRDDHSGICGSWPVGLLRRALLVAGARLHEADRLPEPDAAIDCTARETAALLRGAADPSVAEISERTTERTNAAGATPPPVLGQAHPAPDPSVLPLGLRTIAQAMDAFRSALDAEGDAPGSADDRVSTGVGIGVASHRGRAVVASTVDEAIERMRQGDVLVTPTTTPSFNCILPIAGALVTVHGGPMSHAGIVARELGIPAVVGISDALDRISDGDLVEVDPVAGTVTVLLTSQDSAASGD